MSSLLSMKRPIVVTDVAAPMREGAKWTGEDEMAPRPEMNGVA
jgi:hypothetical protein